MSDNEPINSDLGEGALAKEFPVLRMSSEQLRLKVLFVKAGYAQAGDFALEQYVVTSSFETEIREAVKELEKLGLAADGRSDEKSGGTVYFARTQQDLNELRAMGEHSTSEQWGKIYGIPDTAIRAYPKNVIPDAELPSDITINPLFEAIPFMPSKGDYREEWNEFVERANNVKVMLPQEVKLLGLEGLFKS